jgi:peptidoglycan/LPS O-acetylase OafA/YrhL
LTVPIATDWLLAVGLLGLAAVLTTLLVGVLQQTSTTAQRVLCNPAIREVGRLSYGIYLWHLPVLLLVRDHIPNEVGSAALGIGLSVTAAALSRRFVEQPFLRMKRRWATR